MNRGASQVIAGRGSFAAATPSPRTPAAAQNGQSSEFVNRSCSNDSMIKTRIRTIENTVLGNPKVPLPEIKKEEILANLISPIMKTHELGNK